MKVKRSPHLMMPTATTPTTTLPFGALQRVVGSQHHQPAHQQVVPRRFPPPLPLLQQLQPPPPHLHYYHPWATSPSTTTSRAQTRGWAALGRFTPTSRGRNSQWKRWHASSFKPEFSPTSPHLQQPTPTCCGSTTCLTPRRCWGHCSPCWQWCGHRGVGWVEGVRMMERGVGSEKGKRI